MALLDGPAATIALSLVQSLGSSGSYYRQQLGGTESVQTVRVAVVGLNRQQISSSPLLEDGDMRAILPRLSVGAQPEPRPGDRLVWRSRSYHVLEPNPIVSGDEIAAWDMVLRPVSRASINRGTPIR